MTFGFRLTVMAFRLIANVIYFLISSFQVESWSGFRLDF